MKKYKMEERVEFDDIYGLLSNFLPSFSVRFSLDGISISKRHHWYSILGDDIFRVTDEGVIVIYVEMAEYNSVGEDVAEYLVKKGLKVKLVKLKVIK